MAPIRQPNSRTAAVGKIRDMMQMNAPNEAMIEAAKQWREVFFFFFFFIIIYFFVFLHTYLC